MTGSVESRYLCWFDSEDFVHSRTGCLSRVNASNNVSSLKQRFLTRASFFVETIFSRFRCTLLFYIWNLLLLLLDVRPSDYIWLFGIHTSVFVALMSKKCCASWLRDSKASTALLSVSPQSNLLFDLPKLWKWPVYYHRLYIKDARVACILSKGQQGAAAQKLEKPLSWFKDSVKTFLMILRINHSMLYLLGYLLIFTWACIGPQFLSKISSPESRGKK